MSESQLKDFKQVLLFGFVRRFYKFLIPYDIIHIINNWAILLDEWDEECTDFNIDIDKYKHRIVRYKKQNWSVHACHAFGTDIVENGSVVYWDLKLNSSSTDIRMKIGIIDIDHMSLGIHDFTGSYCFGYGLSTINNSLYHRGKAMGFTYLRHYNWSQGCIIRMELDMRQIKFLDAKVSNNATLKYFVRQDQDKTDDALNVECTAFWEIDTTRKYKLCVAVFGDLNQAELVHVSGLNTIV